MTRATSFMDLGSFVHTNIPSDAEIKDHRSQETVYIGLHVPKQRHRHRRHGHRRHSSHNKHGSHRDSSGDTFSENAPPAQRVHFLLGDGEDENDEHKAHDMFCEMEELFYTEDDMEWKETARWVKFEEDVEEGGERWSKPHVATLSLHSLFELRSLIMNGTVMFDMDAVTFCQISDMLLDTMVAAKQLELDLKDKVRDVLLCRHRHQNEKRPHRHDEKDGKIHLPIIRSLADIGKKYSAARGLSDNSQGIWIHSIIDFHTLHNLNLHFMKKLPQGSEAANILVGEVDFLTHTIVSFIRLSKATMMGDLTEVPVPTKFIFVLLGPMGNQSKFHEIGRSIATLMSDEVFHDVAYHARRREDLLAGIDEFLDQVTVLPPGEWDPSIRIEPPKNIPSQEGRRTAGSAPSLPNGKIVIEEEEDLHSDPTLIRTGRLFGGLFDDVRRKVPFFVSDFKDAVHVQSLASFIFLYFACLTPIITFGGLLGDATGNYMAAFESLLAGAICGITYSLCAGQPLTILGSTGPVLVFEDILYRFCDDGGHNYLELRLWIGIWTGLLLLIIVAFDLSALVRFITRFTEESFALLIALIFIKEALAKLLNIADVAPPNLDPDAPLNYNCTCVTKNKTEPKFNATLNWTDTDWANLSKVACTKMDGKLDGEGCSTPIYVPDVFFFSILIFIGTFVLAMALKGSRNTRFFPATVRTLFSDFAVLIAIVAMVGLDAGVGLPTPKLIVPEKFAPTNPNRQWVVNPVGENPWWFSLAALIPALLATILIFMDQQITAVIVNRKENKLKKGHGYHLDLFIVALLIIVNSFLGLPWFVAATVLSINHVMSLKKESECTAPGERPKFLGVREQRATGVAIFLFIGISVTLTKVLKYIPMSVLFGVFLYMGISSLRGMQLMSRMLIMLMPQKYQPDYMYLRHVPVRRVHLFTMIQVLCLSILWVIKTVKKISIAFPLMVLAMCFVRKGMDWIFTQQELKWLDDIMPEAHARAKEDKKKKKDDEDDDYMDGSVQGSMAMDNIINVPVEGFTVLREMDPVNITEEMSKTSMWNSIVANDSATNLEELNKGSKKKVKKRNSRKTEGNTEEKLPTIPGSPRSTYHEDEGHRTPKKKSTPVSFYIDEEEKEPMMDSPEIIVDPPSENFSGVGDSKV
ncbi:hypothetical protein ScPMuIL_017096 [Solemya velum]